MRLSCASTPVHLSAVLLLASGCALGPKSIRFERSKYNEALAQTNREEVLLNLVRLRYRDSIGLLSIASVATQRTWEQEFTATGDVGRDLEHWLELFGRVDWSERPTVSYAPASPEAVKGLLNPLTTETLLVLANTGTLAQNVMRLTVKRMNNVENAVSASGPIPETPPEFEEFDLLMRHARALVARGQLQVGRVVQFKPVSDPIARDSIKTTDFRDAFEKDYVYQPTEDPTKVVLMNKEEVTVLRLSPQAVDLPEGQEVVRVLRLKPGGTHYEMKPVLERQLLPELAAGQGHTEIVIGIRSLLEIMYFLSTGVEVPEDHVASGVATITCDETGRAFDWQRVLDGTFQVKVSKLPPHNAAVSVKYRGHWFYIDDRDYRSKTTFLTLQKVFALQTRLGGGESLPVFTIPIGGR